MTNKQKISDCEEEIHDKISECFKMIKADSGKNLSIEKFEDTLNLTLRHDLISRQLTEIGNSIENLKQELGADHPFVKYWDSTAEEWRGSKGRYDKHYNNPGEKQHARELYEQVTNVLPELQTNIQGLSEFHWQDQKDERAREMKLGVSFDSFHLSAILERINECFKYTGDLSDYEFSQTTIEQRAVAINLMAIGKSIESMREQDREIDGYYPLSEYIETIEGYWYLNLDERLFDSWSTTDALELFSHVENLLPEMECDIIEIQSKIEEGDDPYPCIAQPICKM